MQKSKRLFIFASYDKDNIIDESVLYYLRALSELGNIVFIMDNDATAAELDKVRKIPNVLYAQAQRHEEYDFGSYKRGYQWADKHGALKKYDWLYLVNDSMFGPLRPLQPILEDLESRGDFVGMTLLHKEKQKHCLKWEDHLQSWFLGMRPAIFRSIWFKKHINNIKKQKEKMDIVYKYEIGTSQLILSKGFKTESFESELVGTDIYGFPKRFIQRGMPFFKKQATEKIRTNEIKKLVPDKKLLNAIVSNMMRCNLKFKQRWRKFCELRLLGLPLIKISRRDNSKTSRFNVFLFYVLPVFGLKVKR